MYKLVYEYLMKLFIRVNVFRWWVARQGTPLKYDYFLAHTTTEHFSRSPRATQDKRQGRLIHQQEKLPSHQWRKQAMAAYRRLYAMIDIDDSDRK